MGLYLCCAELVHETFKKVFKQLTKSYRLPTMSQVVDDSFETIAELMDDSWAEKCDSPKDNDFWCFEVSLPSCKQIKVKPELPNKVKAKLK